MKLFLQGNQGEKTIGKNRVPGGLADNGSFSCMRGPSEKDSFFHSYDPESLRCGRPLVQLRNERGGIRGEGVPLGKRLGTGEEPIGIVGDGGSRWPAGGPHGLWRGVRERLRVNRGDHVTHGTNSNGRRTPGSRRLQTELFHELPRGRRGGRFDAPNDSGRHKGIAMQIVKNPGKKSCPLQRKREKNRYRFLWCYPGLSVPGQWGPSFLVKEEFTKDGK